MPWHWHCHIWHTFFVLFIDKKGILGYNLIMTIKIRIFDMQNVCNINIFGEKNLVEYNGLEKNMEVESLINNFVDIFSNWNEDSFESTEIFDAENFRVEVIDGNVSKKFFGCGNYPENYDKFKNLIGEIVRCF